MSSYFGSAINPKTGKMEPCTFIDDYFGKHKYGVRFEGTQIYKIEDVKIPKESER
jgi:hypothetical protein